MSRSTTGAAGDLPSPLPHPPSSADLSTLAWRKSARSNSGGSCVELAELPGGAQVAMRNSRYPDGSVLIYSHDEIVAFIESARDGDFDHLVA